MHCFQRSRTISIEEVDHLRQRYLFFRGFSLFFDFSRSLKFPGLVSSPDVQSEALSVHGSRMNSSSCCSKNMGRVGRQAMTCWVIIFSFSFLQTSYASSPPKIAVLAVPSTTLGSELTMICSLSSGTKPVDFSWSRDGLSVSLAQITNHPTYSSLYIKSVTVDDAGKYTCSAKNSFGEDSKTADLVITGSIINIPIQSPCSYNDYLLISSSHLDS